MGESPALSYHPEGLPQSKNSEGAGFSGTCESSLTDWIQLVQMGRRDAVVKIRRHDGKESTLWCREGDIIDAACEGFTGEDAVYRVLSWPGGSVSVDFLAVKRRRRIQTGTSGLLLGAAIKRDSRTPTFRNLRPAWLKRRRPTTLQLAVGGGIVALVLGIGLIKGRLPTPRRTTAAKTAAKTPAAALRVSADAPPPLRGMISGKGNVAERAPSVGEVYLLPPPSPPQPPTIHEQPARQGLETKRAGRTSKFSPSRKSPAASPEESTLAEPRVRINEERAPRIQIIEERAPRIQIIEEARLAPVR